MSVKRTISFPETTLKSLDNLVPKSRRSRFINSAVVAALQQEAKENALNVLENMEKFNVSAEDVVTTLREIRREGAARLDI